MIDKLDNKWCKNWIEHLGMIIHTYSATCSQITSRSPYFLMMRRRPQLPVDLLFPTSRQLLKTKSVNEYIEALHSCLIDAIGTARISADQEAARHKSLYDHRAKVVELHHGDKVLVKLDVYHGAHQKLINLWSSNLYIVVRYVVDDIPTYMIENNNGKQKVIHWAWLLLWSSCDEDQEGLQMTVNQLTIFISLSALEPLPDGEGRCRVPYEWSISWLSLNLAVFKSMVEVSVLKTVQDAPATCTDTLPKERVGQWERNGEENTSTGDAVHCSSDGCSALKQDTPSRTKPSSSG